MILIPKLRWVHYYGFIVSHISKSSNFQGLITGTSWGSHLSSFLFIFKLVILPFFPFFFRIICVLLKTECQISLHSSLYYWYIAFYIFDLSRSRMSLPSSEVWKHRLAINFLLKSLSFPMSMIFQTFFDIFNS